MIDSLIDFLDRLAMQFVAIAVQFVILGSIVYLVVRFVHPVSPTGRWKLVKIVLTILFLPLVLFWRFATAGSECGCCCDEDD